MRRSFRVRRQRVVTRPKVRGQRARQAAAGAAVLFLGAAAAATLRHIQHSPVPFSASLPRLRPAIRVVKVEGLPAELSRQVEAALAAGAARSESGASRETLAQFGWLKSLDCRRDWTGGRLLCSAELRTAIAVVFGRNGLYLDDQGVVFQAPAAGYAAPAGPLVEPGKAQDAELAALGAFLATGARSLPSPAQRLSYVSPQEGWRIALEDGTTLLFGNMRWTGEKLQRLGQVMADARTQFPSRQLTADLRYFEDGRILLRPAGGR